MVDRGANMEQLVGDLQRDLLDQGLEVYYRDWIGILQCYSTKYHSQVVAGATRSTRGIYFCSLTSSYLCYGFSFVWFNDTRLRVDHSREGNMSEPVKFSFKRKSEQPRNLNIVPEEKDDAQYITNTQEITEVRPKKRKQRVIPHKKNLWQPGVGVVDDLTAQAIQELQSDPNSIKEESNREIAMSESENNKSSLKFPGVTPQIESTLEEYDDVPVTDFGAALLRGMGWEKGKGVGRSRKVCDVIDFTVKKRTLGVTIHEEENAEAQKMMAEFRLGDYIEIMSGPEKGKSGKILSLSLETSRCIVRLPSEEMADLAVLCIGKGNKEEYLRQRDSYVDDAPDVFAVPKPSTKKEPKREPKSNGESTNNSSVGKKKAWLHRDLKVRVVSQEFRKGKYYCKKVDIVDIVDPTTCTCRSESGKLLENVPQDILETVIPRNPGSLVMLLDKEHRWQVAELADKDSKKECIVAVTLIEKEAVTVSFSEACQYVGSTLFQCISKSLTSVPVSPPVLSHDPTSNPSSQSLPVSLLRSMTQLTTPLPFRKMNQQQQQFGMYGIQPPAQLTPEQMTAMQKQQQMFLKQQQQYLAQQQQLQKQMQREEQRNRLRNMNVRSMGTPTYNQATPGPRVQGGYHGYPQPGSLPQQQQPSPFVQQQQFVQQGGGFVQQQPAASAPYQPYQAPGFPPQQQGFQQGFNNSTFSPSQPQFTSPTASFPSNNMQPSSQPNQTSFSQSKQPPFSQSSSFSQPNQPSPFPQGTPLNNSHGTFAQQQSFQSPPFSQPSSQPFFNSGSTVSQPNSTSQPQISQPGSFSSTLLTPSQPNQMTSPSQPLNNSTPIAFPNGSLTTPSTQHPFPPISSQPLAPISSQPLIPVKPVKCEATSDLIGGFVTPAAAPEPSSTTGGGVTSLFAPQPASLGEEDDDFGDFAAPVPSGMNEPYSAFNNTQSSLPDITIPQTQPKFTSPSVPPPTNDDEDDFGDFAGPATETPFPQLTSPPAAAAPSPSPSLQSSSGAEYIPGTLVDENADVIHSVEMFAKPTTTQNNQTKSEFDKLIEKSLSGKATKSDPKELFRPVSKPAIPSMKSDVKVSANAANWASLDLGGVFGTEEKTEEDDFGDFLASETKGPMTSLPSDSNSNDIFSIFGTTEPPKTSVAPAFSFLDEPITKPQPAAAPILDIFSSNNAPPSKTPDLLDGLFSAPKPKTISESSDQAWSDFTSTAPVQPIASGPAMPLPLIPPAAPGKIPDLYQQIVQFCETPSGIIDVSKVYEVMLTDSFQVIALQPLMGQCNMSERPRAADLIDLIGLVALKQKGFPAPVKADINYQKLILPSVNSKVLKSVKLKSDKPTLLSFVEPEKKEPKFKPVFDFGGSGTIDFANAPFAGTDTKSANAEDDEWGDFGTVDDVTKKTGFDTLFGESQPIDLFSSAPIIPPSSSTIAPKIGGPMAPKSRKPPPKWGIDHDELDQAAVNNIATKNRWGDVKQVAAAGDRDCIDVEDDDDGTCSRFFKDDDDDIPVVMATPASDAPVVMATSASNVPVAMATSTSNVSVAMGTNDIVATETSNVEKVRKDFDSVLTLDEHPSGNLFTPGEMEMKANFSTITTESSPFKSDFTVPPPPIQSESKPKRDLDRLASLDTEENNFDPFSSSAKTSAAFDPFEDPSNDLDRLASTEDHTEEVGESFNPFADFQETAEEITEPEEAADGEEDDFGDFSEFQGGSEEISEAATESSKTDSMALKNLPSKDLDGFWNDMVDSLGPKVVEKQVEPEPAFDFATFSEDPQTPVPEQQQVSYDAFKDTPAPAADEDRLGAWSKCLSLVLATLITCQSSLSSPSPEVLREVVESEKGQTYLTAVTEVFKVACRVSQSGSHEDGVVEIFKEIKHTWTLVSEALDGIIDLPTPREFNIPGGSNEVEWDRNCGICLLDTKGEGEKSVLQYNRVMYHVTCANFWLNSIDDMLPNLNRKLDQPLLMEISPSILCRDVLELLDPESEFPDRYFYFQPSYHINNITVRDLQAMVQYSSDADASCGFVTLDNYEEVQDDDLRAPPHHPAPTPLLPTPGSRKTLLPTPLLSQDISKYSPANKDYAVRLLQLAHGYITDSGHISEEDPTMEDLLEKMDQYLAIPLAQRTGDLSWYQAGKFTEYRGRLKMKIEFLEMNIDTSKQSYQECVRKKKIMEELGVNKFNYVNEKVVDEIYERRNRMREFKNNLKKNLDVTKVDTSKLTAHQRILLFKRHIKSKQDKIDNTKPIKQQTAGQFNYAIRKRKNPFVYSTTAAPVADCRFYIATGKCKFGTKCIRKHDPTKLPAKLKQQYARRMPKSAFKVNNNNNPVPSTSSAAVPSTTSGVEKYQQVKQPTRADFRFISNSTLGPKKVARNKKAVDRALKWKRRTVQQKQKVDCMFYIRRGTCLFGDQCRKKHDPEKVALCRRFIFYGKCPIVGCLFQHRCVPEKMPLCLYFYSGKCTKEDCQFLHVKLSTDVQVCDRFLAGHCDRGSKCTRRHTRDCEIYFETGSCPNRFECKLAHDRELKKTVEEVLDQPYFEGDDFIPVGGEKEMTTDDSWMDLSGFTQPPRDSDQISMISMSIDQEDRERMGISPFVNRKRLPSEDDRPGPSNRTTDNKPGPSSGVGPYLSLSLSLPIIACMGKATNTTTSRRSTRLAKRASSSAKSSDEDADGPPKPPPLIPINSSSSDDEAPGPSDITGGDESNKDRDCSICLMDAVQPVRTPCGHIFCFLCIKGVLQSTGTGTCALCRAAIPRDFLTRPEMVDLSNSSQSDGEDEWTWFYEGRSGGWWQYDARTSADIEKAFQDDADKDIELLIAGFIYVIDLSAMVQQRKCAPHIQRRIKRDKNIPDKKGVAGITKKHRNRRTNKPPPAATNNANDSGDGTPVIMASVQDPVVSETINPTNEINPVDNTAEEAGSNEVLLTTQSDNPGEEISTNQKEILTEPSNTVDTVEKPQQPCEGPAPSSKQLSDNTAPIQSETNNKRPLDNEQSQDKEESSPSRKRPLVRSPEVVAPPSCYPAGLTRMREIIEKYAITTSPTGARADLTKPLCNIFLRGWRLSAQFPKVCSSQGKATILEVLRKVVEGLWDERLLQVPGLRGDINVVEMVVEEIRRDNTRLFSQTPPTLTVLLTEKLFDRYYRAARLSHKPVNLGSSTQQWEKLKTELGVNTNSELASLLIHCYKSWESVGCGRCRRHMQVGMEGVTGRALQNSICIVSCSCGKDTSGGFMIACDNCTKWQHGVCVNVTPDTVPLQYYCPRCTAAKKRAAVKDQDGGGSESGESVTSCGNNELYSTDDTSFSQTHYFIRIMVSIHTTEIVSEGLVMVFV
eukprot:sb/3460349/